MSLARYNRSGINKRILPVSRPIQIITALLFTLFSSTLYSQSFCSSPKKHGMGYSTSIYSVEDMGNDIYNIVLRVEHDGSSTRSDKGMNHYSVEAIPGTYSNVSYTYVYGNVKYNGINLGPNLGGWNKEGFRIASISGIGDGEAGIFNVSYTLTGGLQDQTMMVKSGGKSLEVFFLKSEFEYVQDCIISGAYAMPIGGKINDVNKIGPELTALYQYVGVPVSNEIYEIIHDLNTNTFYVVAEFIPIPGQYNVLLSELTTTYGLINVINDRENQIITGRIPISNLNSLNSLLSLLSARPLYPVVTNSGLLTTSQGDTSMLTYIAREVFTIKTSDTTRRNLSGKGVNIGVISNSYNTKLNPPNQANEDVLKFELPGIGIKTDGSIVENPVNNVNVQVLKEYPYGEATDEGRAMMQIIHDVAPGANLYFRTGVLGAVDMSEGIRELQAAGCDVIVDDITYITQPFFEDGVVARTVDELVTNEGTTYFTSAGNFGNKSYSSQFNEGTASLPGIEGVPHLFGMSSEGEDYMQSVSVLGGTNPGESAYYTIVLQWEDDDPSSSFTNTNTDLDIYLMNDNGSGLIGYNRVNTGGIALEVLPFVVKENSQTNIIITKASGDAANIKFKYIVFKGQLTIDEYLEGSSTIVGHANARNALSVGAIRYDKTPAYGGALQIMSYSSVGGTLVNGEDRNKPDFTAPNGVNTTVDLGSGDWDHLTDPQADKDTYPNFFGTSAAAPHAAAVAALLMDATQSYYDEKISPQAIKNAMIAGTIGSGSYDPVYGNGFLQADAILLGIANSSPTLSDSITIEGGVPGSDTVLITMIGDYLTESSSIYFNGQELNTTVDVENGTLTAEVFPYSEIYPTLNAYNPPKEGTNGTDGGFSNTIYFTRKPTVIVSSDNVSKSYGENLPLLNLDYKITYLDGTTKTLEEAGLTVEQIDRIKSVKIKTTADELSNVGLWPYYVSDNEILNPKFNSEDNYNEVV